MRMKFHAIILLAAAFASCDVRSGTAIKEMEKFETKPTPAFSPLPTPTPVDPADSIAVDTSQEGETIHINGSGGQKTETCKKLDRIMVNGDDNEIAIKGPCRQIMLNGDRNRVTADASMEFVFNGVDNTINHSRYVNGKLPIIIQNKTGNLIEKVAASDRSSSQPQKNKLK